jgi:hypothetical protein
MTAELLQLWERGQSASLPARAALLLAAAWPAGVAPDVTSLPLGRLDALLMELHEHLFGGCVEAVTACPRCQERVTVQVSLADMRSASAPPVERVTVVEGAYRVEARLPTAVDLDAAAACGDVEDARSLLVERCLVAATREGRPLPGGGLPAAMVSALGRHMAEADPLADVSLRLTCAACSNIWSVPFEIQSFLWSALGAWAARVLDEVHELASAYSWSENEILGLSPWRRRRYLDRVHS